MMKNRMEKKKKKMENKKRNNKVLTNPNPASAVPLSSMEPFNIFQLSVLVLQPANLLFQRYFQP